MFRIRPTEATDCFSQPTRRHWLPRSSPVGMSFHLLSVAIHAIAITKRQWGAFYGTQLDLQLRRRGIKTIVIAGIATNFGVESTARDAFERGYALVFVEDAMAGLTEGAHAFAISTIFPRIGRVRSTEELLKSLT
jgi:nicotinamidase-related amidase